MPSVLFITYVLLSPLLFGFDHYANIVYNSKNKCCLLLKLKTRMLFIGAPKSVVTLRTAFNAWHMDISVIT